MKLKVTFYKTTGKYYEEGFVTVDPEKIHDRDFVLEIIKNQKIVGHPEGFYMVVEDTDEDGPFCQRLYFPKE